MITIMNYALSMYVIVRASAKTIAPISGFKIGARCYANYQCERDFAYCSFKNTTDQDILVDFKDDEFMYRMNGYAYRVEARYTSVDLKES